MVDALASPGALLGCEYVHQIARHGPAPRAALAAEERPPPAWWRELIPVQVVLKPDIRRVDPESGPTLRL